MTQWKDAKRRRPLKAEVEAALASATRALWAEPGAYTTTEPARVTVTIYAR